MLYNTSVLRQQIKKSWKSRQFLTSISNFYLRNFFYIQDCKMKDKMPGLKFRGDSDCLRWNSKRGRKIIKKLSANRVSCWITIITGLRIGNAVSAPWGKNIKDLNPIESDGNVQHSFEKKAMKWKKHLERLLFRWMTQRQFLCILLFLGNLMVSLIYN